MRRFPLFKFSKQLEKELKQTIGKIKHKESVGSLNRMKYDLSKSIEKDNITNNVHTTAKLDTDFQKFIKGFNAQNPNVFDYSDYKNNPLIADYNRKLRYNHKPK